jgi:glyoxylate utilization-related uncharacterized protein
MLYALYFVNNIDIPLKIFLNVNQSESSREIAMQELTRDTRSREIAMQELTRDTRMNTLTLKPGAIS